MIYYYGLTTVTPASSLPLTESELKRSIRLIDSDAQTDELTAKAKYAVQYIEEHTKHVAMPTVFNMALSRFPVFSGNPIGRLMIANGPVTLQRGPVISVDSITYVDPDGNTQTLPPTDYQTRLTTVPAIVAPARLKFWPITDPWTINNINIQFTAGYANAAAVPPMYLEAIKFLTNYRFLNRESDADGKLPDSLMSLVRSCDLGILD